VRIEAEDRAGLERLLRYCARPPFALERLEALGEDRLVITVGRPVTRPPPYRSRRAELPHRAPQSYSLRTWQHGASAQKLWQIRGRGSLKTFTSSTKPCQL
jgi:hypothetical protein